MSVIKDTGYVDHLAKISNCMEVNEQAARLILANMEMRLRSIILVSSNY